MFGVFDRLLALLIQMYLLEFVYVPAIRLFQSFKAMNANTVTASNGPTMKYHRIVALAENKQQNKKKNKRRIKTGYNKIPEVFFVFRAPLTLCIYTPVRIMFA